MQAKGIWLAAKDTVALSFERALDFIFPKSALVERLERMDAGDLIARARKQSLVDGNIHALLSYRHPLVRTAIWEVKYRKNRKIAALLAAVLEEELLGELGEKILFERAIPILMPVPLSHDRLAERGYNQVLLVLEEMVGRGTDFEILDALQKKKDTEPQATLNRKARLRNLDGCFFADPRAHGKTIILIDDVVTTGATLSECRRALIAAGAKKVVLYALAH